MIINKDIIQWCKDREWTNEPKFHAVFCDPPYELGFMGKSWDSTGIAFDPKTWKAIADQCYPGAYLLAFGGTRTFHRIAVAIEDAGFEIRDTVMWVYGSGFPKSHDVSKAIDKRGGADIGWFGPWLRQERERRGINQKELAEHFPSKTGGLTGCIANWELGLNLPTVEQFNKLCDVLGLPFGKLEEAEREIVGKNPNGFGANKGAALTHGMTAHPDVTAPATDSAKQWSGYGTALKPSWEPIIIARLPLQGTVAQNTQKYGSGALNIDGTRVGTEQVGWNGLGDTPRNAYMEGWKPDGVQREHTGRWPANLVHDGSDEVVGMFPNSAPQAGSVKKTTHKDGMFGIGTPGRIYKEDSNSAARFFMSCASQPSDSIMSVCPNTPASSVLGFLITIPATTEGSAQTSAEVLLCEQLVPNVKSAGVQCGKCATSIAHELARIKTRSSGKDLRATLASMPAYANSTPHQNLVSTVEAWQSTDTIPTTENLLRLFGSVLLATDAPTKQESHDFANGQAEATRFRYSAKVSKRERDAGLEGFEIRKHGNTQAKLRCKKCGFVNQHSLEGRNICTCEEPDFEKAESPTTRNNHPTLKPLALTKYLATLILPPKLDKPRRLLVPFSGAGSEVIGAFQAGWDEVVGVEQSKEYCEIAEARIKHWVE